MPPHRPIATPRLSAGNASLSSVSVSGVTTAAPAPWTARAAISAPTLGDERGGGGGGGEAEQAEREHAPAAEPVAERGAGQQEAGERQVVGVDRPLQVGQARADVGAQRGQRGGHDQRVERGHEDAERRDDQRPGLAVLGHARTSRGPMPDRQSWRVAARVRALDGVLGQLDGARVRRRGGLALSRPAQEIGVRGVQRRVAVELGRQRAARAGRGPRAGRRRSRSRRRG